MRWKGEGKGDLMLDEERGNGRVEKDEEDEGKGKIREGQGVKVWRTKEEQTRKDKNEKKNME